MWKSREKQPAREMSSALAVDIAAARSAETTIPARAGGRLVVMTWVSTAPSATAGELRLPEAPTRDAQKLTATTRAPARMQPHFAIRPVLADW